MCASVCIWCGHAECKWNIEETSPEKQYCFLICEPPQGTARVQHSEFGRQREKEGISFFPPPLFRRGEPLFMGSSLSPHKDMRGQCVHLEGLSQSACASVYRYLCVRVCVFHCKQKVSAAMAWGKTFFVRQSQLTMWEMSNCFVRYHLF